MNIEEKLNALKLEFAKITSEYNIVELVEDASCGDFEVIASNNHEVFVVQDFDNYSEEEIEEFEGISWYDYRDNVIQGLGEDSEVLDVQLRQPTKAEIEKYYKDYDPDNCVFNVFVFNKKENGLKEKESNSKNPDFLILNKKEVEKLQDDIDAIKAHSREPDDYINQYWQDIYNIADKYFENNAKGLRAIRTKLGDYEYTSILKIASIDKIFSMILKDYSNESSNDLKEVAKLPRR